MAHLGVDPVATFLARIMLYIMPNTSATTHFKQQSTKSGTLHSNSGSTAAATQQQLHNSSREISQQPANTDSALAKHGPTLPLTFAVLQ